MPTQEQINMAQVELDIANDNYARLADRYNKYQKVFQDYANASPETQERAEGLMQDALAKYEQLRLDMFAAEDRIQQAHAAVNRMNAEIKAAQEAAAVAHGQGNNGGRQTRRVIHPTNTEQQSTFTNNPFAIYQQSQKLPKINNQYVPSQDLLRMNGINVQTPVDYNASPMTNNYGQGSVAERSSPENVSFQIVNKTPTLSQGDIIPQQIQNVRNAYGRDYLKGIRDLEKMGYTIFNQKAYDKYGNVYNLWH